MTSKQENHSHTSLYHPISGTGWQVCDCGATRRVENGQPRHGWHTCALCVAAPSDESAEENR